MHPYLLCSILLFTFVFAKAPERDLAKWLAQASVQLPNVTVTKQIRLLGEVALTLSNFTCDDFEVGDIHGKTQGSLHGVRSFTVSTRDVAAHTCGGRFEARRAGKTLLSDLFSFSIAISEANLTVVFNASSSRPIQAPTSLCKINVGIEKLHFHGSFGFWLNILHVLVEKVVDSEVHRVACDIPAAISANLSKIVAPLLEPPLEPQVKPAVLPSRAKKARLVDWDKDVDILRNLPNANAANLVSKLIDKVTHGTARFCIKHPLHFTQFADHLYRIARNAGKYVSFNLTEVCFAGLDSLDDLLLVGIANESHSLRSRCTARNVTMSFAADVEIPALEGAVKTLYPLALNTSFAVSLNEFIATFQALMASDYDRMNKITVAGLLGSGQSPNIIRAVGTVAAAFYAINFTLLEVRSGKQHVMLNFDNGDLGNMIVETINALLNAMLGSMSFQNVLPNVVDTFITPAAQSRVNAEVARYLPILSSFSYRNGGALPPYTREDMSSVTLFVWGAFTICAAVYFLVFYLSKVFCKASAIPPLLSDERRLESDSFAAKSLAQHYNGSHLILIAVPTITMAHVAVGMWCVNLTAADVRLRIHGGIVDPNMLVADESLIKYSFPELFHDFWNAGAWLTSVLLLLSAVIFPVSKGLLTLYAWAIPMTRQRRGYLLTALDLVTHGICMNFLILCIITGALRAQVQIPGSVVDIVMEPKEGILFSSIGFLLLLPHSQWVLFLHNRLAVASRRSDIPEINVARAAEEQSEALPPSIDLGRLAKISRPFSICGFCMALIAMVFFIMSFCGDLMMVTNTGLGGTIEGSSLSTMSPVDRLTMFGFPTQLFSRTDMTGTAAVLAYMFWIVMVAMPLACCIAWILQWAWSLPHGESPRDSRYKIVRMIAEVSPYLYSWCGADAFWACLLATNLEVDMTAQFIVQKKVPGLCSALETRVGEKCITISGTLQPCSWFLLAAVLAFVVTFVLTAMAFGLRAFKVARCDATL